MTDSKLKNLIDKLSNLKLEYNKLLNLKITSYFMSKEIFNKKNILISKIMKQEKLIEDYKYISREEKINKILES